MLVNNEDGVGFSSVECGAHRSSGVTQKYTAVSN